MSESSLLWSGRELVDPTGCRLGDISRVYDDGNGTRWAVVRDGVLGHRRWVVPMDSAHASSLGVVVGFTRDQMLTAPPSKPGAPTAEQAVALSVHYGSRPPRPTDPALIRARADTPRRGSGS